MGTIIERPRKDGCVAYLAQILFMRDSSHVVLQMVLEKFSPRFAARASLCARLAPSGDRTAFIAAKY